MPTAEQAKQVLRSRIVLGLGAFALSTMVSGALSCRPGIAEPPLPPNRPFSKPSVSTTPTASVNVAPEAQASGKRRDLGGGKVAPLPFELLPESGRQGAWLLADRDGEGLIHARRLTDAGLAPAIAVDADGVFGTADLAGAPGVPHGGLLTLKDSRLCLMRAASRTPPQCTNARADFVVTDGKDLVLIEQRLVPKEKKSADKPKQKGRKRRRHPKPRRRRRPKHRVDPKPYEMRVWLHRLASDAPSGAPITTETNFVFKMPFPGMGVVDAVKTDAGILLLYIEHRKFKRDGKDQVSQGALMSVVVDDHGRMIKDTKYELFVAERVFDHLKGHRDPRLYAAGERVMFVGRSTETSAYEAQLIGHGKRWIPDKVVAVDPWRLAERKRIEGDELKILENIWALGPRRIGGQRPRDAGRIAWIGAHGYFTTDDAPSRLFRTPRDRADQQEFAVPFEARRTRAVWATVAPDGSAMVVTEGSTDGPLTLHRVTASGSSALEGWPHEGFRRVARDGSQPPPASARFGRTHLALVPAGNDGSAQTVSLQTGAALGLSVPPGHAAIVGGGSGLLIEVAADHLTISDTDGKTRGRQHFGGTSPFVAPIVATRLADGGLVVAGESRTKLGQVIAVAWSSSFRQQAAHPIAKMVPGHLAVAARPNAGSWLWDRSRGSVAWLASDGHVEAQANLTSPNLGCRFGVAAPAEWPSVTPGTLVAITAWQKQGRCLVGFPRWTPMGLTWVATRYEGLNRIAEWGQSNGPSAPPTAATPAPTSPPDTPIGKGDAKTPLASQSRRCHLDMVDVGGEFCVDRYEARLLRPGGGDLSPFYPPDPQVIKTILRVWQTQRRQKGSVRARALLLPHLYPKGGTDTVIATNQRRVIPSGYLSGRKAKAACEAAGKRLCLPTEWRTACRGEGNQRFPYGPSYRHGVCNVHRYQHPAALLHENAATGHLDPRLNLVQLDGAALLNETGARLQCVSRWGDDGIYDMVGNLDEWVAKKSGQFRGGFYSRSTKNGCDSAVNGHPTKYYDYSLGVRCCSDGQ